MTPEQWLLTGVSVSWSGWMISFGIGKWVKGREGSTTLPEYRITQMEKRMDQAGQKISDLTDVVQALPDRLRAEFMTRAECELLSRHSHPQGPPQGLPPA